MINNNKEHIHKVKVNRDYKWVEILSNVLYFNFKIFIQFIYEIENEKYKYQTKKNYQKL